MILRNGSPLNKPSDTNTFRLSRGMNPYDGDASWEDKEIYIFTDSQDFHIGHAVSWLVNIFGKGRLYGCSSERGEIFCI